MSTGLEVAGFMLGAASWLLTGAALGNDYWKVSSYSGSVIVSNRQYENLWHSCAEDSSGVSNCRDFQSMLALPGELLGRYHRFTHSSERSRNQHQTLIRTIIRSAYGSCRYKAELDQYLVRLSYGEAHKVVSETF